MFEKFIQRYFSENSFLELANACFNEANVYFARNTDGGIKSLSAAVGDDKFSAFLTANADNIKKESEQHDAHFIVAMPMANEAFPLPYSSVVDECMGEVSFLCAFERVFREREEKKKNLTGGERDEITAVIKILAVACRMGTDWNNKDSVIKLLSDKEACTCVGYDVIQYFQAYNLGFSRYYLKNLLDCIPVIKDEEITMLVSRRAKGDM